MLTPHLVLCPDRCWLTVSRHILHRISLVQQRLGIFLLARGQLDVILHDTLNIFHLHGDGCDLVDFLDRVIFMRRRSKNAYTQAVTTLTVWPCPRDIHNARKTRVEAALQTCMLSAAGTRAHTLPEIYKPGRNRNG